MTLSQQRTAEIITHFMFNEVFSRYMCDKYTMAQLRRMIQPNALQALYRLRTVTHRVLGCGLVCNDWMTGGVRQFSGFREPQVLNPLNEWYTFLSMHGRGGAFDVRPANKNIPIKELYDLVNGNQGYLYAAGVRRIEHIDNAPTWLHMDTAEDEDAYSGRIKIFKIK